MKQIFGFLFIVFLAINVNAQQDFNLRKKHFNVENNLALQGYDPVSYFEGKPEKGKLTLLVYQKGIKYLFATHAHLDEFKKSPEKYEPAFGGWCAYAMGKYGEKVEIDPLKFKIVDGKIYLFYYSIINNTLDKWNKDETALKPKAIANWNNLITK